MISIVGVMMKRPQQAWIDSKIVMKLMINTLEIALHQGLAWTSASLYRPSPMLSTNLIKTTPEGLKFSAITMQIIIRMMTRITEINIKQHKGAQQATCLDKTKGRPYLSL